MSGECNVCGSIEHVENKHIWKVRYKYTNPHWAGPFKGNREIRGDKPKRGDYISGVFGSAVVISSKEVK
jgi:hypothetical protein